MAHSHKGTCQLCGRIHAVNNKTGEIAKHGYTVDYGFFNGTCGGSGFLPLQKDREELDLQINAWERIANKQLSLTLSDIELVSVSVRQNYAWKTVLMTESEYVQAHLAQRHAPNFERAAQIQLVNLHSRAKGLLDHSADMKALADKTLGTDLYPVKKDTKQVKEFPSYSEANEFFLTLKAEGIKASIRRVSDYNHNRRVYWNQPA
tara:strand:+ start:191 stop:805 length:615 start_codon:yes stop_codon:yes gene_type:complete